MSAQEHLVQQQIARANPSSNAMQSAHLRLSFSPTQGKLADLQTGSREIIQTFLLKRTTTNYRSMSKMSIKSSSDIVVDPVLWKFSRRQTRTTCGLASNRGIAVRLCPVSPPDV